MARLHELEYRGVRVYRIRDRFDYRDTSGKWLASRLIRSETSHECTIDEILEDREYLLIQTERDNRQKIYNGMNEPNTSVTKETLIANTPPWATEPTAHYAMRAILAYVQELGMPKSYMIDIAQDFSILHKYPADRFVYCIREFGTQVFVPPFPGNGEPMASLRSAIEVFGKECHWYTYDIHDVRQGDNYNEPQLRPCTAEGAAEYMRRVILA